LVGRVKSEVEAKQAKPDNSGCTDPGQTTTALGACGEDAVDPKKGREAHQKIFS
jgi:hypothetical protein